MPFEVFGSALIRQSAASLAVRSLRAEGAVFRERPARQRPTLARGPTLISDR